jgi:hypothetical protein
LQYTFTATGERRTKKSKMGNQFNYTQYDGAMQYTSTDGVNYTLAEIKNEEGRFVNNSLDPDSYREAIPTI